MESFDLQEEIQSLQEVARYEIEHEHDLSSADAHEVAAVLEPAVVDVAESTDNITKPKVFGAYCSVLKYAENVQGATMSKLLDSVVSGFLAQLEAIKAEGAEGDAQARKMPLEVYAFLIHFFVIAAERVKGGGEEDAPPAPAKGRRGRGGKSGASRAAAAARRVEQWLWQDHIPDILGLIVKVLKIQTQRIWVTTGERDAFVK